VKHPPLKATIQGEGPTVLLLHSGGMSGRQWRRLAEALAPTHRTVAPDFLGSGDNPPWADPDNFDFRLDVEAVAPLVADAPFHVVGHSYGGLVALTLAAAEPSRVLSVAVYDPVAFGVLFDPPDAEGIADLDKAKRNPVFTDDAQGGTEAWLRSFVEYWNGSGAWDALPAPTRAAFARVGRKVYLEVRSLTADRTPARAYAAITAPTLLLHGEASPPAARRVVACLCAAMPNVTVTSIAGAGHMGPITHAGAVNGAIVEHLNKC
jgi:pimeloyl-ACP methyl ester carboxylesterase